MDKNSKQIYVSLQLDHGEIRILVAEYFSTRFNIIRSDSYPCTSISDYKVTDHDTLVKEIKYAVKDCSSKVGADIEKVILVIPSYNFKRIPLKSKIIPENNVCRKEDIARAVSNSLSVSIDSDLMIINPVISRYTVNGIPTRRMPDKEISDEITVDIDLLCADKKMTIDYVMAVEHAGVKVLDIALDSYCEAKESALLEESLKKNLVIVDIEKNVTYLSLLSKGKLASTKIIFDGLYSIGEKVKNTYGIDGKELIKLVKYSTNFETEYPDDVVYALSADSKTTTITAKELNDLIKDPMEDYADSIFTLCKPLLDDGAELVITGEGQQMKQLVKSFCEVTEGNYRTYYPDTIGVRNPSLTAMYGSFIVYREKSLLNNLSVNCVNLVEYDTSVKDKDFDSDGDTITSKIKNLFKQYMKGEE